MVTGAGLETNGLPVGAGDQLSICMMMRPGQETPGQMVTIDQCTCHNGLGPGHQERVHDSFSHRNEFFSMSFSQQSSELTSSG